MWKILVAILIAAALLVGIWFKDGYILGGSEDGLIFYNISHYFHQAQYTWMEYPGLGSPAMAIVAGKPTYFLLSLLQHSGLQGFQIQAGVMFFLLISAAYGILLLVRELFPKLPIKYIFISILFYWFSPISLTFLLTRSLLNYLFFFALLPLASYTYIKGLISKKYIWIFFLNLLLILYSYAFSYIAFIILFWLWIFFITIYFILVFNQRSFPIKYLLLSLGVFAVLNSWWTFPMIALHFYGGANPTTNLFQNQSNIDTLTILSKNIGNLSGIFKLINTSINSADALNWVKLYYSLLLFIIQYFFIGSILYFIIKFRKINIVWFLGSLFITVVFLAKGNNSPFGEIFNFIFKQVVILQVFRNPFEKFSFLLSLIASILLGPSIYEMAKGWKNSLKVLLYPVVLISILVYLGFPSYSALALTNKFPPTDNPDIGYKVKVPEYYQSVEKWLNAKPGNFRYIGFPLMDEGVKYNWEKGYIGVELAVALYDSKGIFLNTSTPFFNQVVPEIEKTFLSDKNFSIFANLLNAKYYLIRHDIDYQFRPMTDPLLIEKILTEKEKNAEVKKVAAFQDISIWENLKWKDNTFYLAQIIKKTRSYDDFKDFTSINSEGKEVLLEDNISLISDAKNKEDSMQVGINYSKVDPTKYILSLKDIRSPAILVFSELYNNGWKATYSDGETLGKNLRSNVFSNAWVINREGSFDVTIEFAPQKWMDIGEKVSIGGAVVALGFIAFRLRKH